MTHPYRYWLALHPDIQRPIGGAKQMHRLAEALNHLGREARIIQDNEDFHPGWFESKVKTISFSKFKSCRELKKTRDILILPETFLPTVPTYAPGLSKIIFNQNGAYSFGLKQGDGFPSPHDVLGLYGHHDLIHVLCISRHDEMLLKYGFQLGEDRVSRLVNGIETNMFRLGEAKNRIISYMPRKNSKDSAIVTALLKQQKWFQEDGWALRPINGLPQEHVAKILRKSLIFLAFGHPEGFGLPLAEAAGCGCYLIGYSGLGGKELLEIASKNSAGQEVAYGDWLGFVDSCRELSKRLNHDQKKLAKNLIQNSQTIRDNYSTQKMITSVNAAVKCWEAQLP